MEYNHFISEIEQELKNTYEPYASVFISHTLKNNNVMVDSVTIRRENVNIAPTIHLTPYFIRHQEGVSMEDILEDIKLTYDHTVIESDFDTGLYTDYERAKDRICIRLINFERNKLLLQDIPHVRFLDLAIVFVYVLPKEFDMTASILIHHSHMALWEVTTETLYALAMQNSPLLLPANTYSLSELAIHCPTLPSNFESNLYVCSNKQSIYGAAVLLYPNFIQELAKRFQCDLTIIPSSVHEVLILPGTEVDHFHLDEMIESVNELELQTTDILSDHAYYYYRDSDEIRMN